MDKEIVKILTCPLHNDSELQFQKDSSNFICRICDRKYGFIKKGGILIPNFLIDDKNWEKGERGIKSDFLRKMQGKLYVEKAHSKKLILDIGCGENARGNINVDCYIPANIPHNFMLANAEYLPFKKKSFDVVLSYYNIEHLVNPAVFLQKIYAIAREKIEIITDNSEWIGDIFFRLLGDGRIFNDEHYYKWSVEYLSNLLNRLGYKKNKVFLLNLSNNILVKRLSFFGKIPRLGNFLYRDLKVEIWK